MKVLNRNIYRIGILISFVMMILLILFGISQTLSYLNTGADREKMLHHMANDKKVYSPAIKWLDTINPGRLIEKQTLKDVEKDYLNAWYVKCMAYQSNLTKGIDDYYTKSIRAQIEATLQVNKTNNISINSTTTRHNLALDFYSADGQLIVLTDKGVREYQRVYKNRELVTQAYVESDYQIMLLLEDGFWRIRHMVKKQNTIALDQDQINSITQTKDGKLFVAHKKFQIKGINYYPQQTPWDMWGDSFSLETISKDFEIINNAGLNTIRIFVPYKEFGREHVQKDKLDKLEKVLNKAEMLNLKVIVTLFDFYGDYSVLDWTFTHRHAEQVVSRFVDHKAILAWDVKNEPNLDFKSRDKENVLAWLKEMIYQIKKIDQNHLVTIGWSDVNSVTYLKDEVDMVSFHYYKNIDEFENEVIKMKSLIHKPLVLQEYGCSSSFGFWNPFASSQKGQASYYKKIKSILNAYSIHHVSWTLYDFNEVPSKVVGKLPWRKHKQKYFGLIDKEGNEKPAFKYLK